MRVIFESKAVRPNEDDLVGCIELVINDDDLYYTLAVFIWPNVKSMREFTDEKGNHHGFFNHPKIDLINGVVKGRDVGYIHLVQNHIGVGVFAHELQHFIQVWIEANNYDPLGNDFEEIADLVGDLTNEFWQNFCEMFNVGPGIG